MDFIDDLPQHLIQPFEVVPQHEFVSIRQWDGTGEFRHWVLVPKEEIPGLIVQLTQAATV